MWYGTLKGVRTECKLLMKVSCERCVSQSKVCGMGNVSLYIGISNVCFCETSVQAVSCSVIGMNKNVGGFLLVQLLLCYFAVTLLLFCCFE